MDHHDTPNSQIHEPSIDHHTALSIRPPVTTEEAVYEEWKDLDQLLLQFVASHSIRPMIAYVTEEGGMFLRLNVQDLLPELTKRGSVDLVEYNP